MLVELSIVMFVSRNRSKDNGRDEFSNKIVALSCANAGVTIAIPANKDVAATILKTKNALI